VGAADTLIADASPGGRPRKTDMRAAMNAIFYLLRTGCPWHRAAALIDARRDWIAVSA
jgi:transposase